MNEEHTFTEVHINLESNTNTELISASQIHHILLLKLQTHVYGFSNARLCSHINMKEQI
jgi:hypothetical protein